MGIISNVNEFKLYEPGLVLEWAVQFGCYHAPELPHDSMLSLLPDEVL